MRPAEKCLQGEVTFSNAILGWGALRGEWAVCPQADRGAAPETVNASSAVSAKLPAAISTVWWKGQLLPAAVCRPWV